MKVSSTWKLNKKIIYGCHFFLSVSCIPVDYHSVFGKMLIGTYQPNTSIGSSVLQSIGGKTKQILCTHVVTLRMLSNVKLQLTSHLQVPFTALQSPFPKHADCLDSKPGHAV